MKWKAYETISICFNLKGYFDSDEFFFQIKTRFSVEQKKKLESSWNV